MPDAKKLAVLDLLARHDVPLIEDDIYGDICFGAERPKPFIALDRRGNTIYCSSFSKTVAPGYRIGWVAAGGILRASWMRRRPSPCAARCCRRPRSPSSWRPAAMTAICGAFAACSPHNIEMMTRAIDRSFPAGTRVSRPAGGFVLWLELPQAVKTRPLFQRALDEGICFAPGEVFSASGRFANCLRLSCGHSWDERIERGVTRLGALATEAMGRGR